MIYKVIAPCAHRIGDKIKERYAPGDKAELPKDEAERLLKAGCLEIETAMRSAPEKRRGRPKKAKDETD